MRRTVPVLLFVVLAVAGCDRDKPQAGPTNGSNTTANTVVNTTAGETVSPPPEPARKPTFEDAPGTVVQIDNRWMIQPGQGGVALCAPAELPADVTGHDQPVRFTLYAGEAAEGAPCRPVDTLISIRGVERAEPAD